MNDAKEQAVIRAQFITAPEDEAVRALCERVGYGAVMDAAARLWARKDSSGAFYIAGDCLGVKDLEQTAKELRSAALDELADAGQQYDNS